MVIAIAYGAVNNLDSVATGVSLVQIRRSKLSQGFAVEEVERLGKSSLETERAVALMTTLARHSMETALAQPDTTNAMLTTPPPQPLLAVSTLPPVTLASTSQLAIATTVAPQQLAPTTQGSAATTASRLLASNTSLSPVEHDLARLFFERD